MHDNALSIVLDGTPDFPSAVLQALYRLTGRSTVELRRDILAGEPVFTAPLFGNDHIVAVPRLEKTIAYLAELGAPFRRYEWVDGAREEISAETMRSILEGTDDQFA